MKILQITASDNMNSGASRVAMDLHFGFQKHGVETYTLAGHNTIDDAHMGKINKNIFQSILSRIFANDTTFFKTNFILSHTHFVESDIVQCHNLHGWYFNLDTLHQMSLKKNVVWTLHDMWAITSHCAYTDLTQTQNGLYVCPTNSPYPKLLWDNSKYLSRRKSQIYKDSKFFIVSPSRWLADKVAATILRDKPIKVIHNGIDTNIFKVHDRVSAREKLNLPLDCKIIMFSASAGISTPYKGGEYVLELSKKFKERKDVIFLCIGGDEDYIDSNIIFRKKVGPKE